MPAPTGWVVPGAPAAAPTPPATPSTPPATLADQDPR
jgi:hypothetical protein